MNRYAHPPMLVPEGYVDRRLHVVPPLELDRNLHVQRPHLLHAVDVRGRHPMRRSQSANRHHSPQRSNSRKQQKAQDPLRQWSEWRKSINDDLGRDLVRNSYRPIPIGEEFEEFVKPSSRSKRSVYNYSSTIDQATHLHKEDFVNFGIPRAQISSRTPKNYGRGNSSSDDSDSDDTEAPFYSISKVKDSPVYPSQQIRGYPERHGYRDHSEERHRRYQREQRHVSPEIIIDNRRHRSYR